MACIPELIMITAGGCRIFEYFFFEWRGSTCSGMSSWRGSFYCVCEIPFLSVLLANRPYTQHLYACTYAHQQSVHNTCMRAPNVYAQTLLSTRFARCTPARTSPAWLPFAPKPMPPHFATRAAGLFRRVTRCQRARARTGKAGTLSATVGRCDFCVNLPTGSNSSWILPAIFEFVTVKTSDDRI